jgi:hypothetical protein
MRRGSSPHNGKSYYNILTPPYNHNSATADVETGSKLIEHQGGKAIREDVDEL